MLRLIHTADWQIGKPYGRVADGQKRFRLQQERLAAIGRIREAVERQQAELVLVAGDLFDSPTPAATAPLVRLLPNLLWFVLGGAGAGPGLVPGSAADSHEPQRGSTIRGDGPCPAPVEPESATAPEQGPEEEGGGGTELTALQGIDTGVDQASIDQRAADAPAQHPGEQKADGLEIAGHGSGDAAVASKNPRGRRG